MNDQMTLGKTPSGRVVRFHVVPMANGRFCFHADEGGYPAYSALSDAFCATLLWRTWVTSESAVEWIEMVLSSNSWHREDS